MESRGLASVVVLAAVLAGCAARAARPAPAVIANRSVIRLPGQTLAGWGDIRGGVRDAATGDPLAGVSVVVSGPLSQMTITEEDGTYVFAELPEGPYLVTFYFGELTIERPAAVRRGMPTRVDQRIDVAAAIGPIVIY